MAPSTQRCIKWENSVFLFFTRFFPHLSLSLFLSFFPSFLLSFFLSCLLNINVGSLVTFPLPSTHFRLRLCVCVCVRVFDYYLIIYYYMIISFLVRWTEQTHRNPMGWLRILPGWLFTDGATDAAMWNPPARAKDASHCLWPVSWRLCWCCIMDNSQLDRHWLGNVDISPSLERWRWFTATDWITAPRLLIIRKYMNPAAEFLWRWLLAAAIHSLTLCIPPTMRLILMKNPHQHPTTSSTRRVTFLSPAVGAVHTSTNSRPSPRPPAPSPAPSPRPKKKDTCNLITLEYHSLPFPLDWHHSIVPP